MLLVCKFLKIGGAQAPEAPYLGGYILALKVTIDCRLLQFLPYVGTLFFLGGGGFAHPRKFLGWGGVRMGAQTEKIKRGSLVRK